MSINCLNFQTLKKNMVTKYILFCLAGMVKVGLVGLIWEIFENFPFSKTSMPALRTTQFHIQWVTESIPEAKVAGAWS